MALFFVLGASAAWAGPVMCAAGEVKSTNTGLTVMSGGTLVEPDHDGSTSSSSGNGDNGGNGGNGGNGQKDNASEHNGKGGNDGNGGKSRDGSKNSDKGNRGGNK